MNSLTCRALCAAGALYLGLVAAQPTFGVEMVNVITGRYERINPMTPPMMGAATFTFLDGETDDIPPLGVNRAQNLLFALGMAGPPCNEVSVGDAHEFIIDNVGSFFVMNPACIEFPSGGGPQVYTVTADLMLLTNPDLTAFPGVSL